MATGTRLGPYEVLAALGAGGMGEVYRARDTTLGRDVALKTLPASFASDPERLARFEREAKTLASLNHPHIAQIYGFERAGRHVCARDGTGRGRGSVAADRPRTDPCRRGVADRTGKLPRRSRPRTSRGSSTATSKPANIKVRPDGVVKVLDFGLAKALDRPRTDAARRGIADRAADCRGARGRARAGDHPPRPQARQHQGARRRRREGARLRARQSAGAWVRDRRRRIGEPGELADHHLAGDDVARDDPRHCGLHVAGAGQGQAGRQAHRHLGVRLRALRDARPAGGPSRARTSATRWPRSCAANPTGRCCPRFRPRWTCSSAGAWSATGAGASGRCPRCDSCSRSPRCCRRPAPPPRRWMPGRRRRAWRPPWRWRAAMS